MVRGTLPAPGPRAVEVAERLDNPPLLAFALGTRGRLACGRPAVDCEVRFDPSFEGE